jgi:hypothetical protein
MQIEICPEELSIIRVALVGMTSYNGLVTYGANRRIIWAVVMTLLLISRGCLIVVAGHITSIVKRWTMRNFAAATNYFIRLIGRDMAVR